MATNMDEMTARTRAGWNAFAQFLGISSAAVAVLLLLMALFLL